MKIYKYFFSASVVVLTVAMLSIGHNAQALSCVPATLQQHIDNASVIFAGKVISVQLATPNTAANASFEVSEYWKGQVGQNMVVGGIYAWTGAIDPPPYFEVGKSYLVFASSAFDSESVKGVLGNLIASISCGRTALLTAASATEAKNALGQSKIFGDVMPTAPVWAFYKNLQIGSRGNDVVELQRILILRGFDIPSISAGTAAKGYFGLQTKAAVQKYQADQKLPTTGFVGPLTRGKLNSSGRANSLNVISPNGGEVWRLGTTQIIKWNAPAYFRATYADISLVPYYAPCTGQVCPMEAQSAMYPYRVPYKIARSSIDIHSYSWKVGDVTLTSPPHADGFFPVPPPPMIAPTGQYTVQICETGTTNCASSNMPFTITDASTSNLPPVINGIDAATTLSVGQTGTWTVRATDPENGSLSYAVRWGDELKPTIPDMGLSSVIHGPFMQSTTFTHSYASSGTYTIFFSVKDSAGYQTQSSVTVQVTGTSSTITVLSPNGGEKWVSKSVQQIKWDYKNVDANSKVDISLISSFDCPEINDYPCHQIAPILDKNIPANQIYNWIVGTDVVDNLIQTGNYKAIVCIAGTKDCDVSDWVFSIVP